jgi:hypothetical protein
MSSSGTNWRRWIGPDILFYRNHGAILSEADNDKMQSTSMIARYTSGDDNHYFGWQDAEYDDVRSLPRRTERVIVSFGWHEQP